MNGWLGNVIVVIIMLVASAWINMQIEAEREQGVRAERAICALAYDLKVRSERSRQYLRDIESGKRTPIPGITRNDIEQGLRNQERTEKILRKEAHCE